MTTTTSHRTATGSRSAPARIVYLVGQLRSGGLERQLCFLLQGLDRERFHPAVVVWSPCDDDIYTPQLNELGVPVIALEPSLSGAAKLRALRSTIRELRPEVVHSYSFYTNFAAWWAVFGTGAIAVGAVQSDFFRDKRNAGAVLGRLSAMLPPDQIFNSHLSANNAAAARTPFVARRRFIVRNGLDLASFSTAPIPDDGRVRILAVGSLLPVKRWDRLLAAAAALQAKGLEFTVKVAGDGPLRGDLERRARELGVADRVRFLGYAPNVPALMAEASFLTHTSDTEGLPNAVIEAMACGRAVVATDVGDVAHLVDDGDTGFVVRRGDDAMLVERMAALVGDPDRCRRMGERGRAKAEREFDMRRLVSETLAVYRAAGWRDHAPPHDARAFQSV